ncbi:MspA family porin [Gordonia sp. NPDC058843]|uniref:MspA family porin n=1 Tax=Gordonia sp. NPDC058843 TaxID=3346648 RepID=UPI0036847A50
MGALALILALSVGAQGTANAVGSSRYHKTQDGIYLAAEQRQLHMRTYQPLDSSPMSRDVFLGGKTKATIKGPRGTLIQGATFESGYQVGYPVSFAASGVSITMTTPSLSVGGQINIRAPKVDDPVPLDGNVNTTVQVIPAQTFAFTVEHGGIKTVPLVKGAMNQPLAYADFAGVQMIVKAAVGPVTIRQYTKMTVRTSAGQSEIVTYGPAWKV